MVLAQLLTRFPNLTTLGDLVLFDDTNEHWNGLAVTIPQHVFPSFAFPPGTSNGWAHPRIRNLGVAIFPRWSGNDMCDTVVLSSFASVVARYFPAVESLSFTFMLPVPFKPLSNVPGVLKAWEEVVTVLPANRINFVGENVGLLLRNGEGVDVQVADTWRLFFEGIRRIGDRIGKKVEADGEF
ncbi:hypothetical protein M427DRAFT_288732 [Gonapodya prolifera JEL478]|uniref:Uncharacterized protein n=1 Tax=Gonapodya prolifera (strain JEL478) TaxID=1344416 RepID=A0A139AIT1_GONPJ|nr:hypothetical protein M427DRAFT_288732 [Gonapodya prolifera JEL478]|eukprot:KXS16638.1 hypothetical protein M427DRAFT_288732 [Gonapodya prolifera JEL478]